MQSVLISAKKLASRLGDHNLHILFTHMAFPSASTIPFTQSGYINGAIAFDFEHVFVDKSSSLPHMLPSLQVFSQQLTALGIQPKDAIVVYDNQGMFSSPRVWWMLKALGHQQVQVLDGGIEAWLTQGFATVASLSTPVSASETYPSPDHFTHVIDKQGVQEAMLDESCLILDARSQARFLANEPEPRPGVRSGHIPQSKNLHYSTLLQDGCLLDKTILRKRFEVLIAEQQKPISKLVFTCGSGVTACILALAANHAYATEIVDWGVYDGSWSEWGTDHTCPITSTT
ncbi:sulfurtransferase [Aliiglaciecola sp. LCG003]|uniref:sulfurtransferase n=1 Tax=Aliiglaciecola sp. LCG003 TaxID=3053655 RepID=UPI0025737682|nr:sulfurtransferase [Aliiglaciecola sp. LCG003]WJG11224.1 sulfurtransferase [Aliiglaciecola sp. LCG003]